MFDMRRRDFITLFGGAAVTWPLAARAQPTERVRRIGALMSLAEDDPEDRQRRAAFQQALRQLGWTEGEGATCASTIAGMAAIRRARARWRRSWSSSSPT